LPAYLVTERSRVVLTGLLTLLELVFIALIGAGVWFIYWPAALIVVGVAGALACEWHSAQARKAAATASRAEKTP
jgi:hypothetical protein